MRVLLYSRHGTARTSAPPPREWTPGAEACARVVGLMSASVLQAMRAPSAQP